MRKNGQSSFTSTMYPETHLDSIHAMKGGFESLKKFTMTCSSHNYELFIQSKHQMRETVKLKTSEQELELEQIAENAD